MNIDMSSAFSSMFAFVIDIFRSVISWLDGIIVFNGFSLLDLNIAFTVFGIIFTVLFSVVSSGVSFSMGDAVSKRSTKRSGKNKNQDDVQKLDSGSSQAKLDGNQQLRLGSGKK